MVRGHAKDSQLNCNYLAVPSVGEEEDMSSVEKNVEEQPPRSEELLVEPAFTHRRKSR